LNHPVFHSSSSFGEVVAISDPAFPRGQETPRHCAETKSIYLRKGHAMAATATADANIQFDFI
jgi:hypothetical protein